MGDCSCSACIVEDPDGLGEVNAHPADVFLQVLRNVAPAFGPFVFMGLGEFATGEGKISISHLTVCIQKGALSYSLEMKPAPLRLREMLILGRGPTCRVLRVLAVAVGMAVRMAVRRHIGPGWLLYPN